jgi:hypothetical protein
VPKQFRILVEKILGDGLHAEGFLDLGKRGIGGCILKQVEKSGLGRVAAFTLADQIGKSSGRREPGFDADLARLLLDGGVLHLDV